MKETITIRPARPEDHPAILAFLVELQDFERPFYDGLRDGAESAEEYFSIVSRAVEDKNGKILIAEFEGRPAGFTAFWREVDDDVLLSEDARPHCYVSDVYVRSAFRGQDFGRALLDAAEQYCHVQGLDRLRLNVIADNQNARKAYEAQGYRPVVLTLEKRLDR